MAPRLATHLLGLCNLVAGALVACAPALFLAGLDGLDRSGARLLGVSLGVVLAAVGLGAWLIPPDARRAYLWMFGVAVKIAGAAVWGTAAVLTGVPMLAMGAMFDLAIAIAVAGLLAKAR